MGRQTIAALTVAGVAGVFLASGCAFREAICSSDEYPVAAVRNTGRACEKNGQAPPIGWVRFPEGKVPQYVGDKWDRYWEHHTLDENGREVTA